MGRKLIKTPELIDTVINALATGVTTKDACAFVGISEDTFLRWRKREASLEARVSRARTEARVQAAALVRTSFSKASELSMSEKVEHAQWYLERTDPAHWGRQTTLRIEGVDLKQLERLAKMAADNGIAVTDMFQAMMDEIASQAAEKR